MKSTIKKISEHPDKDEIISKLLMDFSPNDIHDWLAEKYTNANESKFVISAKNITMFKDTYLDVWSIIQQDLAKSKNALANDCKDIDLSIKNNPTYAEIMVKTASEELDIRKIIKNLCVAIETRFGKIFDQIQADPNNINTRVERMLKEYTDTLGDLLEKWYKFTEAPAAINNTVVQNNVTLQVVDQHINVFHDVIREVLSQMDLETSLYFMEVFNAKMSKLKVPEITTGTSSETRLAEAKMINETINKKINE